MELGNIKNTLTEGKIEHYLNYVPVHKNDLFYIEAGKVHAIGAGVLFAEIEESSNVTYRLYDYNRVNKNGMKRMLHMDKALEVARLERSLFSHQPMRILRYKNSCASELLACCKHFQVERLLLNTDVQRKLVEYRTESNSFHALFVVDGCALFRGKISC